MRYLSIILGLVPALLLGSAVQKPAVAQTIEVDLELVLAVDSSSSVDYREFNLQVQGLAEAFRDPGVQAAIEAGMTGRIAVAVVEWSSPDAGFQRVNIPWSVLETAESVEKFAEELDYMPRLLPGGGTAISRALAFSVDQILNNGITASRQVIDVSGDGPDNWQESLEDARNRAVANGITVNALAILNEVTDLDQYFEDRLIGGPNAFVEIADDYKDFARAIRTKLIREIGAAPIASRPASRSDG